MENKESLLEKAILEVMKEVEGVAKDMDVGSGNGSYKGVSDKQVRIKIRESMIKNGLTIRPLSVVPKFKIDRWEQEDFYQGKSQGIKTKQSVFTEVICTYKLSHISGESDIIAGYGHGVDSQDKGAGKATTYALKNTLLNMFLIPTGVDTDNTHSDDLEVPKVPAKKEKTEKVWLNYETFKDIVEAGNTTEQQIARIIIEDGYKVSQYAKYAIRHYLTTGEIDKSLFFKGPK